MYIFISHSSENAAAAKEVCSLLEEAGHKCFIAPRDIPSGKEYAQEIMLGIERSQLVLLILSEHSNRSPHVLREIEHAASSSIPIAVYKMEEVELTKSMEYFIMTHQWIDGKNGYGSILKCVESLQADLRQQDNGKDAADGTAAGKEDMPEKGGAASERKENRKVLATGGMIAAAVLILIILAITVIYVTGIRNAESRNGQNTGDPYAAEIENMNAAEIEGIDTTEWNLGDTVIFGTYQNEPLTWRVIHFSEDGSEAVLITENIITMKAYDAAESEKFNVDGGVDYWSYASADFTDRELEARVRGSNDWESSDIRTWLNSDKENVEYAGNGPAGSVMSELKNGYDHEAGFLHGFTEEERAAVSEVFLLDQDELAWLEEADVNIFAVPTQAAIEQDGTGWYQAYSLDYDVNAYFWWLREPVEESASECYVVTNGLTGQFTMAKTVGVEGFGIRPAVRVNLH